jgi:hypothetical protein
MLKLLAKAKSVLLRLALRRRTKQLKLQLLNNFKP